MKPVLTGGCVAGIQTSGERAVIGSDVANQVAMAITMSFCAKRITLTLRLWQSDLSFERDPENAAGGTK
ncbi:MAG: hypothetical protein AAGD96_30260 [Chloroflexota bacterium]